MRSNTPMRLQRMERLYSVLCGPQRLRRVLPLQAVLDHVDDPMHMHAKTAADFRDDGEQHWRLARSAGNVATTTGSSSDAG